MNQQLFIMETQEKTVFVLHMEKWQKVAKLNNVQIVENGIKLVNIVHAKKNN